jgi:glycosyltransferase involved in cell wall biosynthesis
MTACPTILQVLPALGTGGLERGAIEIARATVLGGGRALVACHEGPLLPALHACGAVHIPLDLRSKSPIAISRNARRIADIIRREKVDLVHARSRAPAWAALRAARRTNVPFVTTWHGVHEARWWGKKRYNSVLAKGDRVIAISQYIADRLRGDYAVGPDQLRLIPRGADLTVFDPARVPGPRVQALAQAWAIPDDVRVIMLPGRLTPWKGQLQLIEALPLLASRAPGIDWVCVLVGPGGAQERYTKELTTRARALGIAERLRFSDACADMAAAMALADVVVVPSQRPEPFGRVVVEAQAMGRPVVVANHGAAAEIVRDGETGLLVAPNDTAALAQGIADVLTASDDALAWLAERARAHIVSTYGIAAMQSATLGVYDELLNTDLQSRFELAVSAPSSPLFPHARAVSA